MGFSPSLAKGGFRTPCATSPLRRPNDNDCQPTSSVATCEAGWNAQLLLSVWFVQHSHLLCAAVGPRPPRNGDYSGLSVVGSSVAGQSLQAQSLDVQYRGCTDCPELCDYLSHCSPPA